MPILGKLIKHTINLTSDLLEEDATPAQRQSQALYRLLDTAKDTAFGHDHDFEGLLSQPDLRYNFSQRVPIYDYDKMYQAYWHRLLQRESNVSWPGHIEYFALSSGTSGSESKRIPVSEEMIEAVRKTGTRQLLSLKHYDVPDEVFESEILMLGSSIDLRQAEYGQEGQISGISASRIPTWLDGWYYRPGKEIAAIHDWDERIDAIIQEAPNWNIGALAGIPAWVQLMLKRIIAHYELNNIHELWPNLSFFSTGGVPFEPYRKSFERLLDHPLHYLDTYLASEGFFAYTAQPDTLAMQLALDQGCYFEFIPFGPDTVDADGMPKADASVVPIERVQTEQDYVLLVSTPAGAWRYMVGDTIRFTDLERGEIIITGRTSSFLNVVGSQLSEHKLNQAVAEIEKELDTNIEEYTVAAVQNDAEEWGHQWYLGLAEGESLDSEVAAEALDRILKDLNKNYAVARSKALKHIWVKVLPSKQFYEWLANEKQKGGQTKMPRVIEGKRFGRFRDFIQAQ
jgi:hypothetical protein